MARPFGIFSGFCLSLYLSGGTYQKINAAKARKQALSELALLPDRCYSVDFYRWTHIDDWKPHGYTLYYRVGDTLKLQVSQFSEADKPFHSKDVALKHFFQSLNDLNVPHTHQVDHQTLKNLKHRLWIN